MKNIKLISVSCIILILTSTQFCFGNAETELPFFKTEKLIHHLEQVNAQWKVKKTYLYFFKKNFFQNNKQRIQL